MVDDCRRKLVNVMSGMPQVSVLFLLYALELFSIQENKVYGYDYTTFVAVLPFPGEKVAVTESLNSDLNRVSIRC